MAQTFTSIIPFYMDGIILFYMDGIIKQMTCFLEGSWFVTILEWVV